MMTSTKWLLSHTDGRHAKAVTPPCCPLFQPERPPVVEHLLAAGWRVIGHIDSVTEPITTPHEDPLVAAFLIDGKYASIDEWMADSDYVLGPDGWMYEGAPVDPEGCIAAAIEASEFGSVTA